MRIQGTAETFGNPPASEPGAELFDMMLFGMLTEPGVDVERARAALNR